MKGLRIVVFVSTLLAKSSPTVAAPHDEADARSRDPVRTWLVMPYAQIPSLLVNVETPESRQVDGQSGDYEPNTGFQFGVRGVYDGWAVTLGSSASTVSDEQKGKTHISDLGAAHYARRFGIYARMQRYRGMYSNLDNESEDGDDESKSFARRPDIVASNVELNAIYILDPAAFSLKAAFDQGETQVVSGGSLLAMVSMQLLLVKAEADLMVPQATRVHGTEASTGLTRAAATTLSLLPGYGYTFVMPKEHYATMAMHIGGGLQQRSSEKDGRFKDERGTGMKVALQLSLGRNADDYLYGFSMNYLSTTARFQGVAVEMTSLPVTFFGGIRI